jgi:hypothetical protein
MGLTVCAAAAGAPGAHASARVGAAKASLGTYAGNWTGHTRSLRISTAGHAKELVGDGCCDPIVNLRFTISHVTGTKAKASATATVTRVHVEDKSAFSKKYPAPKVGDTGKLRLKHGIITEPFVGAVYCDRSKENQGACGA